MGIVDFSIRRSVVVSLVIFAMIIGGGLSYFGLTLNELPEATVPIISVSLIDAGVAPDQMETKIAKKVEDVVGQVSGIKHITTRISEGIVDITIEFVMDKDPNIAAQEIRDKISSIRKELPKEMDDPIVAKYDLSAAPILSLAVTGDMDSRSLAKLVDDVITKQFQSVQGVGSIQVYGKQEREIKIQADADKLAEYDLNPVEIVNALRSGNIEQMGGTVENEGREISLRTDNRVRSLNDFANIQVAVRSGHIIAVRDVATVIDGSIKMKNLSYYDGKPAISIDIVKQTGSNTVAVADKVKHELELIQRKLPQTVQIKVIRDNSESIRESVNGVVKTIIEGCILAILVVFIFLGEWETTLISAVSLPVSIITTFMAMKVMNFSLNTMSLMALSLAVGLLVDDAIVVIENIVRHLHMGKTPLEAAKDGTAEIGLAVLATTMAVVAVFLPIGMVSGMIGQFFKEFGLTIAFSMLISLLISFTLVPLMGARMLKSEKRENRGPVRALLLQFNKSFEKLSKAYVAVLTMTLKHRWKVLGGAMALFVGSILMISALGFAFVPTSDNGEINISAELDSGLTLDAQGEMARKIEAIVRKSPEVRHIYTTVNNNYVKLLVQISDKNERKLSGKEISQQFREQLEEVPGIKATISVGSATTANGKDVTLIVQGDDLDKVRAVAIELRSAMEADPHSKDVAINDKVGKLETKLKVDRETAEDLGVDVSVVADTLNALYDGIEAGKFDSGNDRFNIRMSLAPENRESLESLDGIFVNGSNGKQVPLSQLVQKELSTSAASINRYDRNKQIEVSANVHGMASGDYLNAYFEKGKLLMIQNPGVIVGMNGDDESLTEGFASLLTALGMGILFMYIIMAMQFGSYIEPIAIMFALPMALIGAVGGLFVAGSQMSIFALIGVILLMGLVAKNGILLVDFSKQKQADGLTVRDSLIEAGRARLRPILMTSAAMIFGMIPVAVATGSGTEMRAPMGQAVIGGLISSTVLTLFIVPVVYSLLNDFKQRFFKKKKHFLQTNPVEEG